MAHICAIYGTVRPDPTQAAATVQARVWQSGPCTGLIYATPSPCKSLMTGCCFGRLRETSPLSPPPTPGLPPGVGGGERGEGQLKRIHAICSAGYATHITSPTVGVPSTIAIMCTSGSGRALLRCSETEWWRQKEHGTFTRFY